MISRMAALPALATLKLCSASSAAKAACHSAGSSVTWSP